VVKAVTVVPSIVTEVCIICSFVHQDITPGLLCLTWLPY